MSTIPTEPSGMPGETTTSTIEPLSPIGTSLGPMISTMSSLSPNGISLIPTMSTIGPSSSGNAASTASSAQNLGTSSDGGSAIPSLGGSAETTLSDQEPSIDLSRSILDYRTYILLRKLFSGSSLGVSKILDSILGLQVKSNALFQDLSPLTNLLSTLNNSLTNLWNSYQNLGRRLFKRSTGMQKRYNKHYNYH